MTDFFDFFVEFDRQEKASKQGRWKGAKRSEKGASNACNRIGLCCIYFTLCVQPERQENGEKEMGAASHISGACLFALAGLATSVVLGAPSYRSGSVTKLLEVACAWGLGLVWASGICRN